MRLSPGENQDFQVLRCAFSYPAETTESWNGIGLRFRMSINRLQFWMGIQTRPVTVFLARSLAKWVEEKEFL